MSSVSKSIADDVIAGKYDSDNIVAIIEYSNVFNGAMAYKLVYEGQDWKEMQSRIACRSSKLYWSLE